MTPMPPRIDFAFGVAQRVRTACEVVHKHYRTGQRLLVYSTQATVLRDFDQELWRFEATAFVPHVVCDDPLAAQTPVLLCGADPERYLDVANPGLTTWLVNLDQHCPPGFVRFERILEIVSRDAQDTQAARARWREYTAAGCTLKGHDLSAR